MQRAEPSPFVVLTRKLVSLGESGSLGLTDVARRLLTVLDACGAMKENMNMSALNHMHLFQYMVQRQRTCTTVYAERILEWPQLLTAAPKHKTALP